MIRRFRPGFAALVAALSLAACAERQSDSYDTFEDMSLEAWIAQHCPDLAGNYQEFGDAGYYIDVIDPGDPGALPINDTACWVTFDFSARDLGHRIVLTRRAPEARFVGTFTKYTHYVPFYRYCGTANTGLSEGTYLAMRNVQKLGETYFEKYAAERGFESRELLLRPGSEVVLYCPSRIVGNMLGDGGYEGQFSLESGKPIRIEMKISSTVKNPVEAEGTAVARFCEENGKLQIYSSAEKLAEGTLPMPSGPDDPTHPYNLPDKRWVSACDSVPQVYVNLRYRPDEAPFDFGKPYAAGVAPFVSEASMDEIDRRISKALVERFGEPSYTHIKDLKADSVGMDGKAKIWYIGRFLDGFIFDTNIDEVKQIIYGEVKKKGEALSYTPEEGGMIQAWYYAIPGMKFGQWASLVTVSTSAYGSAGKTGSTSTQTSSNGYSASYLDYLNYLNYINSYYGYGGGYGSYYPGYYGNYMNGYYGNPYYGTPSVPDQSETTVTTEVYTEILPFTPLLFQIYIEPEEEK